MLLASVRLHLVVQSLFARVLHVAVLARCTCCRTLSASLVSVALLATVAAAALVVAASAQQSLQLVACQRLACPVLPVATAQQPAAVVGQLLLR